jgi:hypothetical protein
MMLISFFDANGIVHSEFVPDGQTVNQVFWTIPTVRLWDLKSLGLSPQPREGRIPIFPY